MPGVPAVEIPAELLLPLILPPLLYAAAQRTSWRAFISNLTPIVLVAFAVVLVTLVLQGLTLRWLVRRLGVGETVESERAAEQEVAAQAVRAALDHLEEVMADRGVDSDVAESVREHYRGLLAALDHDGDRRAQPPEVERLRQARELDDEVLQIARAEADRIRTEAAFDPRVVDRVIRRLELRALGLR